MALPPTTVTFPDQAAIVAYLENHPLNHALKTPFVASIAPDSIKKVAQCFANKVMSRDGVKSNLETALADPAEEKKLKQLFRTITGLVQSYNVSERDLSTFTKEMVHIHAGIQCPAKFVIVVALFEQAVNDLLDRATFVPSPSGDGSWVKLVPQ